MKKRISLLIIVFSAFVVSIACSFLTTTEVPTNIPASNTQIPAEEPILSSGKGLCKSNYMRIVNDTTKVYAVQTTIAGSTLSSTNYETILYFDDRKYFSVNTRLGSTTGYPLHEHWACRDYGLIKTAFAGGEFSAYFTDDNGYSTSRTSDWCAGGVTLPHAVYASHTWTQETDFEFTSSNLNTWNWLKWNFFRKPVNSQTLPLPAGSGRFIYNYKAIGTEQVIVPAGTYKAIRIDVIAEGYIDPSRDFSPTFEGTTEGQKCHRNSNQVNEVNPLMSMTFEGTTWWVSGIGWVKKVGTISNPQGVIERFEMELESYKVP